MTDSVRDQLTLRIRTVFADVPRPGNWALCGSYEGPEGPDAATAFSGLDRWQDANATFLHAGRLQQLHFLSDEAFRYFLPAFLVADLEGNLDGRDGDVVWLLTSCFRREQIDEPVNPGRFGARTWADCGRYKFSTFTKAEAHIVVEYLRWKLLDAEPDDAGDVVDALDSYWLKRT